MIGAAGEAVPAADGTMSTGGAAMSAGGRVGGEAVPVGVAVSAGSSGAPAAGPAGGRIKASPLARRIAARLAVDLAAIRGSGPHGRVIRADVERAAAAGAGAGGTGALQTGRNGAGAHDGRPPASGRGETTRIAPTALQRTVARRMSESRASVPDIELRVEADMSRAVELRAELRELAGDAAPSLNDFIVKAAALALREFPRVNGAYVDGGFESYARVNVGVAVAAPDGLLVPTIFDADRSLARRARGGRAPTRGAARAAR